jgi:hypothetical protein
MMYYKIRILKKRIDLSKKENLNKEVGVLFLPMLTGDSYGKRDETDSFYCIVSSDWKCDF